MKQLSFEKEYKAIGQKRPPQPNVTVAESEKHRIKPQAKEILARLKKGSVSTGELVTIAKQYNARLNEIRRHLAKIGMTVDCIKGEDGNNSYHIVALHGSNFQKKLMKRSINR